MPCGEGKYTRRSATVARNGRRNPTFGYCGAIWTWGRAVVVLASCRRLPSRRHPRLEVLEPVLGDALAAEVRISTRSVLRQLAPRFCRIVAELRSHPCPAFRVPGSDRTLTIRSFGTAQGRSGTLPRLRLHRRRPTALCQAYAALGNTRTAVRYRAGNWLPGLTLHTEHS